MIPVTAVAADVPSQTLTDAPANEPGESEPSPAAPAIHPGPHRVSHIVGDTPDDSSNDQAAAKSGSDKTTPEQAVSAVLPVPADVKPAGTPAASGLRSGGVQGVAGASGSPQAPAADTPSKFAPRSATAADAQPAADSGTAADAQGSPAADAAAGIGNAATSADDAGHTSAPSKSVERAKATHQPAELVEQFQAQEAGNSDGIRNTVHADTLAANGVPSPDAAEVTAQQTPDRTVTLPANAAPAGRLDAPAATVPIAGLAVEIAGRALPGRNSFEIRLDPPDLGRIDVHLDVDRDGQVTSRLVVEKPETLEALRRDSGDLERAFQQAGLKTSDNGLQFALRDQSFGGRNDGGFTQQNPQRLVVPDPQLAPIETVANGYGRMLRPAGGIDISV